MSGDKEREDYSDKGKAAREPLRVLCIGTGDYWLEHWKERSDARIAGIVDHYGEPQSGSEDGGVLAVRADGIPVYGSVEAALEELRPELVTMVTPSDRKTDLHLVETVIGSGCDLFLEKFRPAERGDWKKLLELSRSTGRQVGIGEPYRYDKFVEEAKRLIGSGRLGRVEQLLWRCHVPKAAAAWMNAYDHVMLEDLSYHHFGAIHYLLDLGRIGQVVAASRLPSWTPEPSPSVVSLIADGEDGLHINYYASWAAHGRLTSWIGEFRIEGSLGLIELKGDTLLFVDPEGREQELGPLEPLPHELRAGVVDEYVRSVLDGRRSDLDIGRFYPALRLIEAALLSTEQGKVVTLGLEE